MYVTKSFLEKEDKWIKVLHTKYHGCIIITAKAFSIQSKHWTPKIYFWENQEKPCPSLLWKLLWIFSLFQDWYFTKCDDLCLIHSHVFDSCFQYKRPLSQNKRIEAFSIPPKRIQPLTIKFGEWSDISETNNGLGARACIEMFIQISRSACNVCQDTRALS